MKHVAVLAVTLALAGCARAPGAGADSGVRGVVLLGPSCPVEREGSPCPDTPFVGKVRAVGEGVEVETDTDDRGAFTVRLEPGTYTMQAVVDGGGPPTAAPLEVSVRAHEFTDVTLTVDTGIR